MVWYGILKPPGEQRHALAMSIAPAIGSTGSSCARPRSILVVAAFDAPSRLASGALSSLPAAPATSLWRPGVSLLSLASPGKPVVFGGKTQHKLHSGTNTSHFTHLHTHEAAPFSLYSPRHARSRPLAGTRPRVDRESTHSFEALTPYRAHKCHARHETPTAALARLSTLDSHRTVRDNGLFNL